jgi:hypothetical protein
MDFGSQTVEEVLRARRAAGVGDVAGERRRSGVVLEEPANLLVRPLEGRAVLDAQGGADHKREQREGYEVDKDEAHLHQMMLAGWRTSVTSITGHVGGGDAHPTPPVIRSDPPEAIAPPPPRSWSSWPRSHGSPGAIGSPHRAQLTPPAATWGAHRPAAACAACRTPAARSSAADRSWAARPQRGCSASAPAPDRNADHHRPRGRDPNAGPARSARHSATGHLPGPHLRLPLFAGTAMIPAVPRGVRPALLSGARRGHSATPKRGGEPRSCAEGDLGEGAVPGGFAV